MNRLLRMCAVTWVALASERANATVDAVAPASRSAPPSIPTATATSTPAARIDGVVSAGWCVIVEEQPLTAYARAAERAARLRAVGYQAAVYDTRSFKNLAWGELVVIAQSFAGPTARAQAVRLATALGRLRGTARVVDAYAKPCVPIGAAAAPIKRASDLAPLPSLPSTPLRLSAHLESGCLAWSSKDRAALCVVGTEGHDIGTDGNEWSLKFLRIGDDSPSDIELLKESDKRFTERPPLSPAQLQQIQREIHERLYVSLDGVRRTLAPGETFHSAVPRYSVRWLRTRTKRGVAVFAPTYHDRILIRCGSPSRKELLLVNEEGPHEPSKADMAAISGGDRGGPVVVITTHVVSADEGSHGHTVTGYVIDLTTCNSVSQ